MTDFFILLCNRTWENGTVSLHCEARHAKIDMGITFCIYLVTGQLEYLYIAVSDCRRGQSLVVHAINEGRQAAREVDLDLMGRTSLAGPGGIVHSQLTPVSSA